MDLTGKIKNLAVDYFSKKITVTLEINEAVYKGRGRAEKAGKAVRNN